MNNDITKGIISRFYEALDMIIAQKQIRGVNTYCRLYEIDRRNLIAQRKDLNRGWFQVGWIQPLVTKYGISSKWILTGSGNMMVHKDK